MQDYALGNYLKVKDETIKLVESDFNVFELELTPHMCVAGKKGGTKPGPFAFIDDVKVFMGGSSKQVLATVDSVG